MLHVLYEMAFGGPLPLGVCRGLCVDAAHADPPRPVQELQLQGGARRPRS
jgi:hypothetical protein